tara:strand:- start:57 stop:1073 length:1017 start_codon:yes stop_codon:yes gene_type:complete
MKYIHAYKLDEGKSFNDLELLTQLLSVLKLKVSTKSKIVLYVDEYTLSEYKKFGLDTIYDEVNTEVLESYPSDRISKRFWSSPKIWVMKHQEEPFCIIDTDLVLHNLTDDVFATVNVSALHTESPTSYPFPTFLNKPEGFEWTDYDLESFKNSFPLNCAAVAFNDMDFLRDYTDAYFEFVLDNEGGYTELGKSVITKENGKDEDTGDQITIEQWLLSALIKQQEYNEKGVPRGNGFISQSLTRALSFPLGFEHQMYNAPTDKLYEEISTQLFHLWGAKKFFEQATEENNQKLFEEWDRLKNSLISTNDEFIKYLGKDEWVDVLEKLKEYCREIPKATN